METRKNRIMTVNAALLIIGLADLVTTLFWLRSGLAVEINPIMAAVLRCGVDVFVTVKLATLLAYVVVIEWYRRRRNPEFARIVGRITLISYLSIYAISFACVNAGLLFG
ncbi:MAG: DUF5658 family protein [Armatimonadota bacterium]